MGRKEGAVELIIPNVCMRTLALIRQLVTRHRAPAQRQRSPAGWQRGARLVASPPLVWTKHILPRRCRRPC